MIRRENMAWSLFSCFHLSDSGAKELLVSITQIRQDNNENIISAQMDFDQAGFADLYIYISSHW